MPNRRHFLRTAGNVTAATAVGLLAARGAWLAAPTASGTTSELGRDLRVGYLPITDASALLVAHEGGFWRNAGISSASPTLFRSWDSLAQAFVVGEVDVAHLLMPLALQLKFSAGAPIRIMGWGHTNGSAFVVAKTVTDLRQLAGKKVAVPFWWSIHSILAQTLLRKAGLSPVIGKAPSSSQAQLVVLPPAEMVAALASNQIAGFVVADPFNAVAELREIGGSSRMRV